MFITFHLSISFVVDADADVRSNLYGKPPWIQFALYGVHDVRECFGKLLYGCNLLLTIQDLFLLLPQDIRFSTNEGVPSASRSVYREYVEGSLSSSMLMYVCIWGNVYSLCVRGLSRRRH